MKSPKTIFACQECGAQSAKWLGRCADCGAWNSLVEERAQLAESVGGSVAPHRYAIPGTAGAAQLYADITLEQHARLTTGIDEFDRVLGGGVVPGSLVLLGGEPGIGKSTLLLQAAANMARTAARSCTAPAKSRSIRSSHAASGSRLVTRRSTCWRKPASNAFSRRSRGSNQP